MKKVTVDRKVRRKRRISQNITGSASRPRIAIFRSNRYIYAQAIDDAKKLTLASSSSLDFLIEGEKKQKKDVSEKVGEALGAKLMKKGVKEALFDRGRYAYHGRVQRLADGIRKVGIKV